ncbi:MAG: NYN domain-containing protein [Chloroflexota bacterium]
MKRAYAYIDGFNLYYRAVKGTAYKWLNLRQMCEMLVPEYTLERIKYFTAPVSGKDEAGKPIRQQTYLRALRTIGCEVIRGKFLSRDVYMRLAEDKTQTVLVTKTEEKGSDVNLAAHLLIDGFDKHYEAAIVLSNDSDLTMPIRYVRDQLGFEIMVINPDRFVTSKSLTQAASSVRQLREGVLQACQFPEVVKYPKGVIKKPANW